MKDTCKGKDCWLYILMKDLIGGEKIDLEINNCPFYQEMIWTPSSPGEKVEGAKVIKDCTNKRSLLFLLEDIHPRMMGVQESQEQMRNESVKASSALADIFQSAILYNKKNASKLTFINDTRKLIDQT